MTCQEFEQSLPIDPQQALDAAQQQHLAHCVHCTQGYGRVQAAMQLLAQESQAMPHPELPQRVLQHLRSPYLGHSRSAYWALAAAMLAGLLVGLNLGRFYPADTEQLAAELSYETYYFSELADESIEYNLLTNNEE